LDLTCPGPFAILDGSFQPEKRSETEAKKGPNARAQTITGDMPLILGSSLSGALRARAVWLENLRRHQAGLSLSGDSASIERLFGTTGFRGLLLLEDLTLHQAQSKPFTSVKLDRFSGAPIDNALVTVQAFTGVQLRAVLAFENRTGQEEGDQDEAEQAALAEDRDLLAKTSA